MGALMRSIDWSKTPVGPAHLWPHSLKVMVRVLLDCKIPMCVVWGEQFTQFYNDAYRPILGNKHPAQGIGTPECWDEIWPKIGPMFLEVRKGQSFGYDHYKLTIERFGYPEDCYFNFSYSPLPDDDGSINGVLVTYIETTELIKNEISLREARDIAEKQRVELYNYIMLSPLPTVILEGPLHKYILANPPYENFIGRKATGKYIRDVFQMDEIGSFIPLLDQVYKEGIPYTGEEYYLKLQDKNGVSHIKYIDFGFQPYKDPEGNTKGVLVIIVDTTEKVEARKKVENSLKSRDEFISIVSHELKTPVTSLKLQFQMIRRGIEKGVIPTPEKFIKIINMSLSEVERLSSLIEDLLDASRVQLGKLKYYFQEEDIVALVKDVIDRSSEDIKARIVLETIEEAKIVCDKLRIEQVILNLLDNALKYAPDDEIKIKVYKDEKGVSISVSDKGIGIDPKYHKMIFERFESRAPERAVSGLGLGLYITREIVHEHGGSIVVHSELGKGATFLVHLPYRKFS